MCREKLEHLGTDGWSLQFCMVCMHPVCAPALCTFCMRSFLSLSRGCGQCLSPSIFSFGIVATGGHAVDTESAVEFLESDSGWLAFTTWHQELELKTNHLGSLPLERRLKPGVCPSPGVPLELQFTLPEVFPLLLLGSPASGAEQQLWQCAPPLAGNHDEGFRVSEDAQRYVAFKSHVMVFFEAWEFPQGEAMRTKLGMVEGRST